MRRFILKKEYPNSPVMGSIITNFPQNVNDFYVIGDESRTKVIECPWKYPEYYTELYEITTDSLFDLVREGGVLVNAERLSDTEMKSAKIEGRLRYINDKQIFAYIPPEQLIPKNGEDFWDELMDSYTDAEIPDLVILKPYTCKKIPNSNAKPAFFGKGERFVPENWQFHVLKELLTMGVVDLKEEFPKNVLGNKLENFGKI